MGVYLQQFSQKTSAILFNSIFVISAIFLSGCNQEENGLPKEERFITPTVSQLIISPTAKVNTTLTAEYEFIDTKNRLEGESEINWYIDNKLHSLGAQFTPTNKYEKQWLYFCVTPVAAYGNDDRGVTSCSTAEVILPAVGSAPVAKEVLIVLPLQPGSKAQGSYIYFDDDEDLEADSVLVWRLNGAEVAQGNSYLLPVESEGMQLSFCVTPKSLTGEPNIGMEVCDIQTIIGNYTPPTANQVLITPSPITGKELNGTYLFSDANNRPEGSSKFSWQLNGVDINEATNSTITLSVTDEGKSLSFCVIPVAVYGQNATGVKVCSTPAIVLPQNFIAPIATNVIINPSPIIGTTLTGTYLFNDANSRPEGSSKFSWQLNGVDIIGATNSTITLSVIDEGKTLSFCVIPVAAYGQNATGVKVCSTPIIVLPKNGSAPVASNLTLSSPLQPGQVVTGNYLYIDNDGDSEGSSITQWFIDGIDSGYGLNLTLPVDSEAKALTFCVTPVAKTGFPKQGLTVCRTETILGIYIAPTATNVVISPTPTVGTQLTGTYLYTDANNRPEGSSKFSWQLNGIDVNGATNSTITPSATDEGRTLSFCVIPVAAYGQNATGVKVCSSPTTVLPKSGSAPVASNLTLSSPLQPGQVVTGNYLYSDNDGDSEGASITQWFIDGIDSGSGLSITLPIDSEAKTLRFCVTPVAKTGLPKQGLTVCRTETILGIYIAPTATNVAISPTPTVGTQLTGIYLFNDTNSRPEGSSKFSWQLNGVDIIGATNSTITLSVIDEGKTLSFCVIPVAAYGQNTTGVKVCSAPTIILPKNGSAPVASNLTLSSPLQPGQVVTANYLYSDNDGDIEGVSLTQWLIDGLDSGSGLSMTLPIDSEAKTLTFCVTPIAQTGLPKQGLQVCLSETILGSYTAPTATSVAINPNPIVGTTLTGSYVFTDTNSRPEGSSEFSWKVDGIDRASDLTILISKSDEGKDLSFCITPVAAYGQNATGTQVCTNNINIDPKVGSAPSATNLTWDTFAKPSTFLTVSYDFNDADGDTEGVSLFSWKLNNVEVSQNISYTPPADSGGKSLEFCVTPVAVTGTPKVGSEQCISTDIAAILLSGELQFNETLTLDIKGYTNLGVIWRSTNPANTSTRSTSNTAFTITRGNPTESAFALVGHDIEVCITTAEEGQLCSTASSYDSTIITGGIPMAIDGSFAITQRAVAPIPYVDLTIGLITKRLHRPLSTIETSILNNAQPAIPLFDNQRAENGTNVFWGLFTWPNSNTQCIERGYTLTVDGINDTSDPFGLKQFYDHIGTLYPAFAFGHVTSGLGWGSDVDYYWSISDVGGGSHADVYMVSGSLGSIADTTPEYAACIEILP